MYSIRNHTGIVADPSTCRRHCESKHAVIITLFLYLRYLAYKLAGKIQKLVQESRIRFETRWGCGCAEVKGRTIATNNWWSPGRKEINRQNCSIFRQDFSTGVDRMVSGNRPGKSHILFHPSYNNNTFCSRFKHLNIRSSRKWSMSPPAPQTVSKFLVARLPEMK